LTTPDTAAHIHCCQMMPGNPPHRRRGHHSAGVCGVPSGSDAGYISLPTL
jgi:hypothetical protein